VHDYKGFSASLRLRYFGPRDLTSDGINRSLKTALLNGGLGYQFNKTLGLSAEFLNMLNRYDDAITYAYLTRVSPNPASPLYAPKFTNVYHPTEPFQVRFGLHFRFE
jgi:hypothetical protein